MTLAQKEVFQASKILVDFLRDFTSLSEQQLLSCKKMLEGIVEQVMRSMTELNDESARKVKAAKDFVSHEGEIKSSLEKKDSDIAQVSENSETIRRLVLESKLLRSSGTFSKNLEAISMLNTDLQKLLAQVIGAVSLDDVIAQRLSHVIESLQTLQSALAQFLKDYKSECRPERVKLLRNQVLTKVYLSYSSEEERDVFHKIFGHPKSTSKAS